MSLIKWFGQRETFSEQADYFVYDELPSEYRFKVLYEIRDALDRLYSQEGGHKERLIQERYQSMENRVLRAFGLPYAGGTGGDYRSRFESFLQLCSVQQFLVILEVFFEDLFRLPLNFAHLRQEIKKQLSGELEVLNKLA